MADRLAVYLYGRQVAHVLDAGFGDAAVQYTDEARDVGAAAQISLAMPIRASAYSALRHGTRWVRGLLPEGRALAHAIAVTGVAEDDRFGLLAQLGRDVAGALIIVPDGEPADEQRHEYVPLSRAEVEDRVRRVHAAPLGLEREGRVRLSLAGMQDKLALHLPEGSGVYHEPLHGSPSTIIVKPEPVPTDDPQALDLSGIATNEAFCLHLARASGLEACESHVERFAGRPALVVRRYDRRITDGQVSRIHQEDLLMAMGRDPLLKYETPHDRRVSAVGGFALPDTFRVAPGPTLDAMATFIDEQVARVGVVRFLDAVTFNVAIGNADAHPRNLSVLLGDDATVELAPLYDLVSTRAFEGHARTPAQSINGIDDIDQVRVADLTTHGSRWLHHRFVERRVGRLLDRVEAALEPAAASTVEAGGDGDQVQRLVALVQGRLNRLRGC